MNQVRRADSEEARHKRPKSTRWLEAFCLRRFLCQTGRPASSGWAAAFRSAHHPDRTRLWPRQKSGGYRWSTCDVDVVRGSQARCDVWPKFDLIETRAKRNLLAEEVGQAEITYAAPVRRL